MWLSGSFISAYVPIVCRDSELLVISPKLRWFRNRNPWKYFIFKVRQCHSSRRDCLLLFLLNTFQVWICTGYLIDMWCLKYSSHCCILYFIPVMEAVCNTGKLHSYRLCVPSAGSQVSEVKCFFLFFLQ